MVKKKKKKKVSYFEREAAALESFMAERLGRKDVPCVGEPGFEDILKFQAYACRKFGLLTRAIQDMVVAQVIQEQQPWLIKSTESVIDAGMDVAVRVFNSSSERELNRFAPFGFRYISTKDAVVPQADK